MNDGRLGLSLAALSGLLLAVTALAAPGPAEERSATTRVDLFDQRGQRTGHAEVDERTGRVDFFDKNSRRTGYGVIDSTSGRVDRFDTRGNRVGSGQIAPGSTKTGGRR
jgi:hypothetical protein